MAGEITLKDLNKYKGTPIPKLIKLAEFHFNAFIRERDKATKCISCSTGPIENAGHYYSAGHYPPLRFDEDDVHGQCIGCNKWKHGNLIEYRKGLVKRIGEERIKRLDLIAEAYRRNGFKWDKVSLIEIIVKYRERNKG